jgi:hypothetical protein
MTLSLNLKNRLTGFLEGLDPGCDSHALKKPAEVTALPPELTERLQDVEQTDQRRPKMG